MESKQLKIVYTITERGERSFWTRIGVGWINRDGSMNLKLDAVPVNGTLQVRDWTPRDEHAGSSPETRTSGDNGARAPEPLIDDLPNNYG